LSAQAEGARSRAGFARRGCRGLAGAVALLTIVPMPLAGDVDLADATVWFPLVGGAIGALAAALLSASDPLFGRGVSTALAMIALVVISGALHQDGLADTADALGVRGDRARRLEVMRDSRVGAFGVLALIGWALLLFTALEPLTTDQAARTLVGAAAAARLGALLHGAVARPARLDGLGAALRVTPAPLAIATGFTVAIVAAADGPVKGGVGLGACALLSGLSAVFARRVFGGRTGDTLGATVAITELAVCLALMAMWRG
jgi:adenosylcobinamide-GDP ribazoletransferase